jgi:hypothetical protein
MSPPHPGAVNRPGHGTTSGVPKKPGESPRRHTRPDSGRWRARPGTWHSDKVRTRAYGERKKPGESSQSRRCPCRIEENTPTLPCSFGNEPRGTRWSGAGRSAASVSRPPSGDGSGPASRVPLLGPGLSRPGTRRWLGAGRVDRGDRGAAAPSCGRGAAARAAGYRPLETASTVPPCPPDGSSSIRLLRERLRRQRGR